MSDEIKNEAKTADAKKRRNLSSILGDYKGEYKKIIWPSRETLVKETLIVIVTCVILGAVITTFDLAYSEGVNLLFRLTGN